MTNEIVAASEATKAVAETAGKAIDASRDAGGFLSRIIGPALEEMGWSWYDRIKYRRAERLMQLEQRFQQRRAELGFSGPWRHVSPKLALPLLEAASLEDDDDLLDMFATLLANAAEEDAKVGTRRAFVTMLEELEPFDARVLLAVYTAPPAYPDRSPHTVYTAWLPETYLTAEHGTVNLFGEPRPEVAESIWNLARLGLMQPGGGWDGVTLTTVVTLTSLGHAFIAVTTTSAQREAHRPIAPVPVPGSDQPAP